ncbi:MAG: OmpA family protein, partial [Pseudomonadota bacterium]
AAAEGSDEVADTDGSEIQAQLEALTDQLAERDATIAELQAGGQPSSAVARSQECDERANAVLANSRISFLTGSAQISQDSVPLLERLAGIALACVSDTLAVEIGGHTDDRGSDENNQALSEARAQAVVAFMTDRGVPADSLQAVGFGETQPIADNATAAGRAENRRITFGWQPL